MKRPIQPTLEAARELAAFVAENRTRVDAERVTLAWKSPVEKHLDYGGTPLFSDQSGLFDQEPSK